MKSQSPLALVSGRRVLFLDLAEIEHLEHVKQVVDVARKHPANPLLPLGNSDEWDSRRASPWLGGVLWSPERTVWQLWYSCGAVVGDGNQRPLCYAESGDGVEWHKPALGLHAYHGSTRNNIALPLVRGIAICRDEAAPPERRYQANISSDPLPRKGRMVMYSPDGIRWHFLPPRGKEPVLHSGEPGEPDSQIFDVYCAFYDGQERDPQQRYKAYAQVSSRDWVSATGRRGNAPPLGAAVRRIGYCYGPDAEHLTKSRRNPILAPEDEDAFESQNHYATVLPYEGLYVMLYEYNWEDPATGQWRGDLRLAVSRDGEHWRRVQPNCPVVPRGSYQEWDGAFLVSSMSTMVTAEQIRIYYSGQDTTWAGWPADQSRVEREGVSTGYRQVTRTGLATLRRDGFCHLESADGQSYGAATTVPLTAPAGSRVQVNVSGGQLGRSWLEVEALDVDTGNPLPGYARADSPRLWSDGLHIPVRWGDGTATLPAHQPFRLRFHLVGGIRLYAFVALAASGAG